MKSEPNPNWWMNIDPQFVSEDLEGVPEMLNMIKGNDQVELPEDENFYNQMHDKIMSGIENRTIHSDRGTVWSRNSGLVKKAFATAVALVLVLLGKETTKNSSHIDSADINLSDAVHRSDSIERTILVYQHKDDFLVDLAQKNLDHFLVINMQETFGPEKID